MSDNDGTIVPVWTLTTGDPGRLPVLGDDGALTPGRLAELRTALAAFAASPLVTLEAHPLPAWTERPAGGLPLHATSPLARELSRLVMSSTKTPNLPAPTTEVLYRMHVPAKVAGDFSKNLVKPMASKAVKGGLYGDLVATTGKSSIAAKATFVPVQTTAAGAGGTALGAATAGGAIAVAAPLVLMAVAVGASAYADQQRQRAIDHIGDLLEKLHDDKLEAERSELDGCSEAVDKATALLLDQGKVGASLGLDSAVHAINTAAQRARTRVSKWEKALDKVLEDGHVDVGELSTAFPGLIEGVGEFPAHLEMAALAIALKRRVVILQGVEAGQSDPDNAFENFVETLRRDQQRIDELEDRITAFLGRLSAVELRSPKRMVDKVMTRKQVDSLLDASYRLRSLAPASRGSSDVVIDIEQHQDGTLLVLPTRAA